MKKLALILSLISIQLLSHAQNPAIYPQVEGKGPVLMFLPGFTSPASVFDSTIHALEGDYQVIKVSYAGFNGHPAIGFPWYASIKKELIQYIREQGIEKLSIIGHSMGGTLAIDLAAELADVVDKLVLIDALPCMRALMMPGVPAEALQYESPYNEQILQQSDSGRLAMAKMMSMNMTNRADKVDLLVKWSISADLKTFVYGYTDLLKLDLREALEKVKANALVLGAEFPNKELVHKNLQDQYQLLKNKEIKVVDNSKHFIMFDQATLLNQEINSFLN